MKIEHTYARLLSKIYSELNTINGNYIMISATLDSHNNIIEIGRNSYTKTHPMQSHYCNKIDSNRKREYLHAEIAALVKTRKTPSAIMVIRVTKNSSIKMARPCNICALAIKEASIKYIYYSGNDCLLHLDEMKY